MRKPFQRQSRSSISFPIAPCQASSVHEPVRNVRCVDMGMMGKENGEGFLEDNDMHMCIYSYIYVYININIRIIHVYNQ